MFFLLISLADKNPDKLSHLRYNSEGVGRGLFLKWSVLYPEEGGKFAQFSSKRFSRTET